MKDMHAISLKVNGRAHELVVEARRTLADMLRHDLGYTGFDQAGAASEQARHEHRHAGLHQQDGPGRRPHP